MFLLLFAQSAYASNVDSIGIQKLYMDGEFEPAIAILESDLHSAKPLSHNDSVFIYKHLGVMYAAQYETREKGKMYMFQLLTVEPTAKIMDMYASDMIYMIFKNIQDEYQTKRARVNPGDTKPESPQPRKSGLRTGIWIGAAVVVVGVGFTFLLLALSSDSGNTHSL